MSKPSDSRPLHPVDEMLTRVKKIAGIETDEELAERLGIPVSNVKGWQIRRSMPTENIRRISEMLGIHIDILMKELIANPEKTDNVN